MDIPLTEFDPAEGVLAPRPPDTAEALTSSAVLCFFPDVLRQWSADGRLRPIGAFSDEVGGAQIYVHEAEGLPPVTVFHPGMGAPLATHCLEQVIAAGVERAVAVGGAGAVSESFDRDAILVVAEAVRDEGTSYHYLPAARSVRFDADVVSHAIDVLDAADLPHHVGTIWTTDADFRETPRKIDARVQEGCLAVDMEAAALAAVCRFRRVAYGQLVYSGDSMHGEAWDGRDWTSSDRRGQMLELALAVVRLH